MKSQWQRLWERFLDWTDKHIVTDAPEPDWEYEFKTELDEEETQCLKQKSKS